MKCTHVDMNGKKSSVEILTYVFLSHVVWTQKEKVSWNCTTDKGNFMRCFFRYFALNLGIIFINLAFNIRTHSFNTYTKFSEKLAFLPPDTHTYVCVSRGKKC